MDVREIEGVDSSSCWAVKILASHSQSRRKKEERRKMKERKRRYFLDESLERREVVESRNSYELRWLPWHVVWDHSTWLKEKMG